MKEFILKWLLGIHYEVKPKFHADHHSIYQDFYDDFKGLLARHNDLCKIYDDLQMNVDELLRRHSIFEQSIENELEILKRQMVIQKNEPIFTDLYNNPIDDNPYHLPSKPSSRKKKEKKL